MVGGSAARIAFGTVSFSGGALLFPSYFDETVDRGVFPSADSFIFSGRWLATHPQPIKTLRLFPLFVPPTYLPDDRPMRVAAT
jgi:hypothetical protein